jgi:hypothetical protein
MGRMAKTIAKWHGRCKFVVRIREGRKGNK